MEDEDNIKFLSEEYKLLMSRYGDIEVRALSIKGWISAGMLAFVGLALKDDFDPIRHAIAFSVFAVLIAIAWIYEGVVRVNLWGYTDRIRQVEAHFDNYNNNSFCRRISPFQIHSSWEIGHSSKTDYRHFKHAMINRWTCLPYAPLIILSTIYVIFCVVFYTNRSEKIMHALLILEYV